MYFCPIGALTFEATRPQLAQSTTPGPLEFHNRMSGEHLHKMGGRLDHSKQPKRPIYYTPVTMRRLDPDKSDKTKERYLITAQQPVKCENKFIQTAVLV